MESQSPQTIAIASNERTTSKGRLFGFDALRAFAAVLVVMLHAAHAYIPNQMPGLVWPAHDANPSPIVNGLFWWVEGFIMPLFLFLSGYFALGLLRRLGETKFIQHRFRRIVLPLLFGCVVILPLDFYAWGIGLVLDGRATWRKLRSLKFDPQISDQLWGLSHLWYLQYLFLYCLILAGVWMVARWFQNFNFFKLNSATALRIGLLLMPCVCAVTLFWDPEVVIGFQHGFLPVASKFVYSGMYFFAGAIVLALPQLMERLQRTAIGMLIVSVPLAVAMIEFTQRNFQPGFTQREQVAYSAVTVVFAWLTVGGLTGLFLRIRKPIPARVGKLAAASFWIYLLHHPLVGLLQALLGLTTIPSEAKFLIVTLTTLAICLSTYEWLVKDSWIGQLLHGRRAGRASSPVVPLPTSKTQRRKAS